MTQKQQDKLSSIFKESGAVKHGSDFWSPRIETMPPAVIDQILSLFEAFPAQIDWFAEIQLRKEEALAKKDHKLWEDIITEEKRHLSNILNKGLS